MSFDSEDWERVKTKATSRLAEARAGLEKQGLTPAEYDVIRGDIRTLKWILAMDKKELPGAAEFKY